MIYNYNRSKLYTMSINYISKLYKSRVNLLFYMNSLGFDTSEHDEFTMEEIQAKYTEGLNEDKHPLNMELVKYNQPKKTQEELDNIEQKQIQTIDKNEYVSIRYILKSRPGNIEQISNTYFTDVMESKGTKDVRGNEIKNNHTLILVVQNPPNDTIVKTVKQVWSRYNEYVVIFDISALQINILKHQYVPPHRKLDDEEKEKLYVKYNVINDKQLPEISIMDPVARAILLRPGQVCEITRYDKISFSGYYYRICVCQ